MKKTNLMKLIVLVVLVIMITIPTIVFAELKVPSRKGTVSGKGTEDKPYILQLGEPIIDIYYDVLFAALADDSFYHCGKYNNRANAQKAMERMTKGGNPINNEIIIK